MSEKTEVIQREEASVVRHEAVTPMQMLQAAIDKGTTLDQIEKLMELDERWQERQAKAAFMIAKAEFKKNPPIVVTDKVNSQYGSGYSSLANTVNTVNAAMSPFGLNASWDIDQENSIIKVTCHLDHTDGHRESVSMSGPPDSSGSKNAIQQIRSTTTYLRALTFEAVTGIATVEAGLDDDGNAVGKKLINDEQQADILALLDEVPDKEEAQAAMFKFAGVDTIAEIPAKKFDQIINALEARREGKK